MSPFITFCMDSYVESQCVEKMKEGDPRQFLALFDAYFIEVYKYVVRRVGGGGHAEEIVRQTFLDALGQIQNTPENLSYAVWLYSLARIRVFDYIEENGFPSVQGVITTIEASEDAGLGEDLVKKAEKMFGKLSLEEREILRLKFFEEVSDADVMAVLGMEDGAIGPQIYRVLKRAHFLLFGESQGGQGVYFGEISGFLGRLRKIEQIEEPIILNQTLRGEVSGKIDRRDFAIDVEAEDILGKKKKRFDEDSADAPKGSNDPAKIFVEAVKEMRAEEEEQRLKAQMKEERKECLCEFLEKWRLAFSLIPAAIFSVVLLFIAFSIFNFWGSEDSIERGFPTVCEVPVEFGESFADGEIRDINRRVSDRICAHFIVGVLKITKSGSGITVFVDSEDWLMEYGFVKKDKDWRIKRYVRTPHSDQKSG
jgi:RNA polymerase sigma-70 factor, ECF subfamily